MGTLKVKISFGFGCIFEYTAFELAYTNFGSNHHANKINAENSRNATWV